MGISVRSATRDRWYGKPPHRIVLIHGGPGAAGEMAPVAEELSLQWGVVEAMQTARSVNGQVEELHGVVSALRKRNPVLVGFSWGAWLALLCAGRYPDAAAGVILIGCGPLRQRDAAEVESARFDRLSAAQRARVTQWMRALASPDAGEEGKQTFLRQLGTLFAAVDAYAPVAGADAMDGVNVDADIFSRVWPEADEMRRSGRLLSEIKNIRCPLVAIHGDYDPHPGRAVRQTLAEISADFRYLQIARCGHRPWLEKFARETFFEILDREIRLVSA